MKVWINGNLIDEEKATISIFDRSYLYGEGLFETYVALNGKPVLLDRHFERLLRSCDEIKTPVSITLSEIEKATYDLLKANHLENAVFRLTSSQVGASFGVGKPTDMKNNATIFCRPHPDNAQNFKEGVRVYPHPTMINDTPSKAHIKSTSYLTKMIARMKATEEKAYDTLFRNSEGYWVEGSRTNFFLVLNGEVLTPPLSDALLGGITREVVLEILKEEKIPFRETHITSPMLLNAEAVFLTGTTTQVMPIRELIGFGEKDPKNFGMAERLRKIYQKKFIET